MTEWKSVTQSEVWERSDIENLRRVERCWSHGDIRGIAGADKATGNLTNSHRGGQVPHDVYPIQCGRHAGRRYPQCSHRDNIAKLKCRPRVSHQPVAEPC